MKQNVLPKYLFNCFWFIIPPLLISFLLLKHLPAEFQSAIFWSNIPLPVKIFENVFRIIVMALPVFFPIVIKSHFQRMGLVVYVIGITLYLFSYLALIYFPGSSWSESLLGFSAAATTPLIWFTGIGLIMDKPFFKVAYRNWIYVILVITFCSFHFIHTSIIYYQYH